MKAFRDYILHSKVMAYVPTSIVKDILVQSDSEGKRGKWIAKLQEYDFEIKPSKLVKGKGLAKLLATSSFEVADEHDINLVLEQGEVRNPQEPSLEYIEQVEGKNLPTKKQNRLKRGIHKNPLKQFFHISQTLHGIRISSFTCKIYNVHQT